MVECPVENCKKSFQNNFSLQGHLRLSKDQNHIKYWETRMQKKNQKTVLEGLNELTTGGKIIDAIESLIQKQVTSKEEDAKNDALLVKLKAMVEEEREIEQEYQILIDSKKGEIERECEKVKEKVMRQYNQDVAAAVTKERNEIMKKWQQAVDVANKKGEKKGFDIGYNRARADIEINLPCLFCKGFIPVEPGSDLHRFLIELANRALVSHPQCRMAYEQEQDAFYQHQEFDNRINRLESKIKQL